MGLSFFLMTETDFHMSYLVTRWIEIFDGMPEFKGVIICGDTPQESTRQSLSAFHQKFWKQTSLTDTLVEQLREIYPNLSKTEQAMIELLGIPRYSIACYPKTTFLGTDPNTSSARRWLEEILQRQPERLSHSDTATSQLSADLQVGSKFLTTAVDKPFIFVFLDHLLEPWWIELTASHIINGHSAVLPYARGAFAIENIAALRNYQEFKKAAGATIHFIDTGIDTGPIIRAERLQEPFCFKSVWECKGYIFSLVFDLLIQLAQNILDRPDSLPVGIRADPKLRGPNFKRKDFTPEIVKKAEIGYLEMKLKCELDRFS